MPATHSRPPRRQQGVAMLLLVVLLGLAGATLLMAAFEGRDGETERTRRTAVALGEANEALLGFAMTHGRLPRPAISALDGRENPIPCVTTDACAGILPWVALGLAPDDGWGKRLRYSVTPVYTREPVVARLAIADKTVIGRNTDGQMLYRMGQATCSATMPCAPAVVYSTGRNGPGTSAHGIAQHDTHPAGADEQHNYLGSNNFIRRPATSDAALPGGRFDDMVVWLPLPLLYQRMNISGVLP